MINLEELHEFFRESLSTLTTEELNELTMEPYMEFRNRT